MRISESDIMYVNESHWVLKTPTCYEVLQTGPTHSIVVGKVSRNFFDALARAIMEADRRHADYVTRLTSDLLLKQRNRLY
jgi:hypothetical protein